jgi:hypothetical protein
MSINYSSVCNSVKNNKKNTEIKLDSNPNFIQSNDLINRESFLEKPKKLVSLLEINKQFEDKVINKVNNSLVYKENLILELPDSLNSIINTEKYYSFGVNKKLSFLDSCFMILDPNYTLHNHKKKLSIMNEFINHLNQQLDEFYKKNTYRKKKCKKPNMKSKLDKYEVNDPMLYLYIADTFRINIIVLDLNANTYNKMNYYNSDYYTLLFIKQSDYYLPIIHTDNEIITSNIIDKIDQSFKVLKNSFIDDSLLEITTENNLTEVLDEEIESNQPAITKLDKQLIELDKFWKYNLKQLQDLANKLDIPITDEDTKKPKLKKVLYGEILTILK